MKIDTVYYKSSHNMSEVDDDSINLIVTSPPYFDVKDYSMNGYQTQNHSSKKQFDFGAITSFDEYILSLLFVWKECERVLTPNGKLCINVPLMPITKKNMESHYNRHIYDIQSTIQQSILTDTNLYLLDIYIWNRTNPSKKLMFGSYPYPRNFYAQNTIEFIAVYVKDGQPINNLPKKIREKSKLSQEEWIEYTKQIWNIPIPNKNDPAFGKHAAIMPEEIARRCIRLYSYVEDIVLDPFAGSGTTLKVARELHRHYVGYELYEYYKDIIDQKLSINERLFD